MEAVLCCNLHVCKAECTGAGQRVCPLRIDGTCTMEMWKVNFQEYYKPNVKHVTRFSNTFFASLIIHIYIHSHSILFLFFKKSQRVVKPWKCLIGGNNRKVGRNSDLYSGRPRVRLSSRRVGKLGDFYGISQHSLFYS